jgi:hypothetical protein
MKPSILLAAAGVVLAGSLGLAIAQSGPSHAGSLLSMTTWSRPSLVVDYGIQMRECIDPCTFLNTNGPSVSVRFEPIPLATIQSLQQDAAAQQKVLAWTPRKISAAVVSIDVVNDSAPARLFKATATAADPRVFEVALASPSGGWYNQPLRIQAHVFADDEEIFSSDSTVTLAP